MISSKIGKESLLIADDNGLDTFQTQIYYPDRKRVISQSRFRFRFRFRFREFSISSSFIKSKPVTIINATQEKK
jgi:hypothetical protein